MPPPFAKSVFVNCPFDSDYLPLFRPLIFTILFLGFEARTAYEESDSGEPRITKLVRLIKGSKYGIHDLSRCKATRSGDLFRLNMPLELGIDYGCRKFCGGKRCNKRFLILEEKRYRFQKAISDLSGSDIKAHKNDAATLILVVRNWLVQEAHARSQPASLIRSKFENFMADHADAMRRQKYSLAEIAKQPMAELFQAMRRWTRRPENIS